MGTRQSELHRATEPNCSDSRDSVGNSVVQRTSNTPSTAASSCRSDSTPSQADQQYDVDITSRRQLNELQRLEQTHGSKVHEWLDEGMPREAMGTPSEMRAFRLQKETPVPSNADPKLEKEAEATTQQVIQGGESRLQRRDETPVHLQRSQEVHVQRSRDRLVDMGDSTVDESIPTDNPLVAEGRNRLLEGYEIFDGPAGTTRQIPGAITQAGYSCHLAAQQAGLTAMGRDTTGASKLVANHPDMESDMNTSSSMARRLTKPKYNINQVVDLETDTDAKQYLKSVLSRTFGNNTPKRQIVSHYLRKFTGENPFKELNGVLNTINKNKFIQNLLVKLPYINEYNPHRSIITKGIAASIINTYKNKKRDRNGQPLTADERAEDDDLKTGETFLKRSVRQGQDTGRSRWLKSSNKMDNLKRDFVSAITDIKTPCILGISANLPPTSSEKVERSSMDHAITLVNMRRENGNVILDIRDSNNKEGEITPTRLNDFLSLVYKPRLKQDTNKLKRYSDVISISPLSRDEETIDQLSRPVDMTRFKGKDDSDQDLHPSVMAAVARSTFDRAQQELTEASESIKTIEQATNMRETGHKRRDTAKHTAVTARHLAADRVRINEQRLTDSSQRVSALENHIERLKHKHDQLIDQIMANEQKEQEFEQRRITGETVNDQQVDAIRMQNAEHIVESSVIEVELNNTQTEFNNLAPEQSTLNERLKNSRLRLQYAEDLISQLEHA